MDTPKIQKTAFYAKCCLCRVFKSVMSVTPTEYINSKRLDYSVYLLTQTSKEIIEISCKKCSLVRMQPLPLILHFSPASSIICCTTSGAAPRGSYPVRPYLCAASAQAFRSAVTFSYSTDRISPKFATTLISVTVSYPAAISI